MVESQRQSKSEVERKMCFRKLLLIINSSTIMISIALLLCLFYSTTIAQNCSPACGADKVCSTFDRCVGKDWPSFQRRYEGRIKVQNNLEPIFDSSLGKYENVIRGGPDTRWLHLHRGQQNALQSTLTIEWLDCNNNRKISLDSELRNFELRYVIGEQDTPVTGWLQFPFEGSINVDSSDFDSKFPMDGIFHLSFEMRGGSVADRIKFAPMAAFAHVRRPGFEPTTRSPIGIYEPDDSGCVDCCSDFGPNIAYVDLKDRKKHGYPVDPEVTPFDGTYLELKQKNELFAEKMNPDSPLFQPINFIWDDPAHPKENGGYVEFVRAMPPKFSESTNLQWDRHSDGKWRPHTLRELHRHQAFPVLDGPRGQGWMSGYVQGQYNLNGVFAFAETSGRVGLLYPDGSIKTIAGFVTDPTKNPVWMRKPMATVRKNQILRGQWSAEGRRAGEDGGFKLPMDVTWDPKDDKVLYVTGFEDHVIWKLEIVDLACDKVNVSVFAGKLDERGDADGKAGAARFDTPSSLIFDPICDCMYVTDQFRGSIRKLTRDATVSTIYGGDNVKPNKVEFPYRPKAMENFSNWHIHSSVYKDGRSTTGAKIKTSAGTKPDLFAPHTIRTTSKGNIMVLDLGFGLIREIDVKTHETVVRTRVYQHMSQYDFGWAWFDLDRWGNSGGLDAIYWTRFTGQVWGNQHGGEAWGDPLCSYGGDGGAIKGLTCDMKDKCLSDCRSYSSAVPDWVCEEPCATDLFAEIYGFTPANNADEKSYMMFTTDRNILPSEGQVQSLDPPHYGWLTAVDPRGALLVGGIGQHGLIRIRKKRATDRTGLDTTQSLKSDQMQTYWQGREIFRKNHKTGLYGRRNEGEQTGVIGLAGVFGYDARNLLGIANAWEIQALSDEAVLDLFRIDKNVRDDAEAKRCVLFFLRHQTGTTSTTKAKTEIVPSQPGQCGSPTPAATTAATTKQTPSGSTKATPKPAVCGNGILEGDEQCDHKDALCCDMECKFKKAGTVCRAAGGECDVADVCTGFDAGCRDKVKDEGESCVASDSTTPTGSRQPDPQCIPPATCDGKTKTCVTPPIGEPLPCDDMKACTTNDQCNLYGLCQGNIGECMCTAADAATVCDDKESCTDDKCVDSKCVSTPLADATACDDNNPCTVNDMCSAGKCQGETSPCPNECSQQGSCKCIDGASKCVCFAGFEGDDCSSATETSCEIGSVFCQCTAGGACDKGLDCAVLPNMEKVCVQTVTSPTDPAISNAALLSVSLLLPVFTLSVACK